MKYYACPTCSGLNRAPDERADPRCGRCSAPLHGHPAEVDDAGLAAIVRKAPVPVLVDFWAPWCAPCRMVAPHLEKVAAELAGRVIVLKVNTDLHSRTLQDLGARGIPTFAVYKEGRVARVQSGAMMAPQLRSFVLSG